MSKSLSREFLLNRGFCCKNGCSNCPYEKEKCMNFEEWYRSYQNCYKEDSCKIAWDACKIEVLKILETNEYMDEFVVGTLEKQINNL